MSTFGKKLEDARIGLDLSRKAAVVYLRERGVFVSERSLFSYERQGKEPPDAQERDAILRALSGTTPLRENSSQGDGAAFDEPDPSEMARYDGLSDRELAQRRLVRLPLIEVAAGRTATDVELNRIGEAEILPVDFVREAYGVEPSRLCVLKVRGNSMDGPSAWISPGSYIRALLVERHAQLRDGAVYAVVGPSGYLLKRLFVEEAPARDKSTVTRAVRLSSDNPRGGQSRIPMPVWDRDYWAFAMALRVEREL